MDPEIANWLRLQRVSLLAARRSIAPDERRRALETIAGKLNEFLAPRDDALIGLYWPIQGEPNLMDWAQALAKNKFRKFCLPVVTAPKAPLEYWRWTPGDDMAKGVWNIPIPARRDVVQPDLMLAPLVGFDRAKYRLGYGGGYFDRTLASLPRRPTVIGIGFGFGALDTIFPQPHDIRMDAILTERPAAPGPEDP